MSSARLLAALAGAAARRPVLVLALATVLGLAGAAFALRLSPSAAESTFVSSSSPEYKATQKFYKSFGEEPIEVLVKGNLQQLVLSSDVDRLLGLEGCLSGNVPAKGLAGEGGVNGPCGQLAKARTVKVVFGPGTFINESAERIDELLTVETKQAEAEAKQAETVVRKAALAHGESEEAAEQLGKQASSITLGRFKEGLATLALQYGLTARPSLDDQSFVSTLVFDSNKPAGTPKARFAYLFPNREAALISARLKAGLSERERTHTIALIREAVAMKQWHLQHGESYLVTGEPVIVADLTGEIAHSIELLLVAVVLVMALALSLIFPRAAMVVAAGGRAARRRAHVRRAVGRGCVADDRLDRGAARAGGVGGGLRDPVPVARGGGPREGDAHPRRRSGCGRARGYRGRPDDRDGRDREHRRDARAAALSGADGARLRAVAGGGRRDRLSLRADRGLGRARAGRSTRAGRRRWTLGANLEAAWRGARELLLDNPVNRFVGRVALIEAPRRPGRVLCVGLALAVLGWGLDTQTHVETNIEKLVPQNLESLQNLDALERATGVAGQLDLMVSAKDLTKPATIEWMSSYESAMLKRFGYSEARGCGQARLCPAFSLPDLFSGATAQRRHDVERKTARRSSRRPTCRVCSTRSRHISPRT